MRTRVLLFGVLRDRLSCEEQLLELPAGAVETALGQCRKIAPGAQGKGPLLKAVSRAALLLCLPALFYAPRLHGQSPTISVNVRLVNVFVNVTDAEGAPVAGLNKDDFALEEDGRPQKIAVFERDSGMPLNIVLALDTSGSVRKDFPLEQQAARRFVHALLRPADRLSLMEFADDVREVVGFTNNADRIDHGLNDIRGGAATALYGGVYLAAQTLAPSTGRKVLVLISDGGNTVKGTTYDMALEEAVRGEVMVYSIIDVPIYASAGRDLGGEHAMITLSEQTGGKHYYADSSSLDQTFAQVSNDLRTQYLLAYYPQASATGDGFRRISVTLRHPAPGMGYIVRNRTGYYPSSTP